MTRSTPWEWRWSAGPLSAALVAFAACSETVPSGPDDSQLPGAPVTVSLQLAWDEFASNLQVLGGYGSVDAMANTLVARAYNGLEARTLLRFGTLPSSIQVRDSAGTLRTDTAFTYIDGYVVAVIDTLASTNNTGVVTLAFGQLQQDFDPVTANWTNAVGGVELQRPWSQPGGGTVVPYSTWDVDPLFSDSATLFLDTAKIREWRTAPDSLRAGRIDLLTDGHRLKLIGSALRLVVTSTIDPDTTIILSVPTTAQTFIYDPAPTPPADGMQVGGAPAWRTILDVELPTTLTGPPALCAEVGCPFTLGPQHVTYAGLGVRTRRPPDAFQPTDTLAFEVRPVLNRASLPKAPLGNPLGGVRGTLVPPALFGAQEGSLVDLPITGYVQAVLAGPDPEGRTPPTTLAILTSPEPQTFSFASFFGPGSASPPVLNLILTVSPPMELR